MGQAPQGPSRTADGALRLLRRDRARRDRHKRGDREGLLRGLRPCRRPRGPELRLRAGRRRQTGVLDDFNRPDGAVVDGWTQMYGAGFVVEANQLRGPGDWAGMVWSTPFPEPHESYYTIAVEPPADDDYMYIELRDGTNNATASGYAIEFDDDYWDLWRIDGGSWTQLHAWPGVHDASYFQDGTGSGSASTGRTSSPTAAATRCGTSSAARP